MAIEAMVAVFQESRTTGTARCVMLAIANQASSRGELHAYARSQSYLTRLANCSRSTLRRVLADAVALGELEVEIHGIGRKQSSYLIHLPSMCEARKCRTLHDHDREGSTLNPLDPTLNQQLRGSNVEPTEGPTANPQRVQPRTLHHSVPSVASQLTPTTTPTTALDRNEPHTPPNPPLEHAFVPRTDEQTFALTVGVSVPLSERVSRGSRIPHDLGLGNRPKLVAVPKSSPAVHNTAAVAPVAGDGRGYRMKKPDSLTRCLAPHGVKIISQTDRRNLDKLAEIAPTLAELDGACNALLAMEGKIELGRLVNKWTSLVEEAVRPAAWTSWSRAEKDRYEAHIAAGGDPVGFGEGGRDYGV